MITDRKITDSDHWSVYKTDRVLLDITLLHCPRRIPLSTVLEEQEVEEEDMSRDLATSFKLLGAAACLCLMMISPSEAMSNCNTTSDCGANANCTTVGGFDICVCDPGYTGDGFTCISVCNLADVLLGISFHPLPGDCTRFVSCDGVTPYVQNCGYGTVWNDDVKTCVYPKDAISGCNFCSGIPDGNQFIYPLLCNSYWQCLGGVAQPMCCSENTTYNLITGCTNGSCSDTCPPQAPNTTAAPCPFTSSVDGPEYYMETVPGFGLIRRDCASGTNFNNVTCGCHDFALVPPVSSVCPMKADIFYDNNTSTFVDNSTNNVWIQINNVALGSEPVFSGSSSLRVFALAGVTYGSNLEISLVFSVAPATPLTDMVLLQNGKCSGQHSSFLVFVNDSPSNSSLMDVTLHLLTGTSQLAINSTLTLLKSTKVRMEFEYPSRSNSTVYTHTLIDDDTGVTVDTFSDVMPVITTIPRKHGALIIGATDCSGYSDFQGSIFKTGIRSCGNGL